MSAARFLVIVTYQNGAFIVLVENLKVHDKEIFKLTIM